jgi:hypothetical protein
LKSRWLLEVGSGFSDVGGGFGGSYSGGGSAGGGGDLDDEIPF